MTSISFVDTRARASDPLTSREAAKNAAGVNAVSLRLRIQDTLKTRHEAGEGGYTARELSAHLDVCYYATQRRLSEVANIRKTGEVRDGAMVWEWAA